jgi:predicted GNAT family N-acyltransferase
VIELRELAGDHTADERAELHDGEVNAFESAHLGIYWEDHERRIVLYEDGRMIACAGLLVAPVSVGGETFDVVGVGGVIVTHSRRGQGLARLVMDGALRRAAELGPEFALLFCRPDRAGFYAKLGFVRVSEPVQVGQPDDKRVTMPLETMWRPLRAGAAWPPGPVDLPGLPF